MKSNGGGTYLPHYPTPHYSQFSRDYVPYYS